MFRSSLHAWCAIRLVYLAEVAEVAPRELADVDRRYQGAYERVALFGAAMQQIAAAAADDLDAAGVLWTQIRQKDVDDDASLIMCERDGYPQVNLATMAMRHYGLDTMVTVPLGLRDSRRTADNEEALLRAPGGRCQSCGTATISERQYQTLRRTVAAHPAVFDLTPTYLQKGGNPAPLWSARVLIAAKGVADHIVPWCQGGRSTPENVANVCAGCNYSRNDTSLDIVRVAAYG